MSLLWNLSPNVWFKSNCCIIIAWLYCRKRFLGLSPMILGCRTEIHYRWSQKGLVGSQKFTSILNFVNCQRHHRNIMLLIFLPTSYTCRCRRSQTSSTCGFLSCQDLKMAAMLIRNWRRSLPRLELVPKLNFSLGRLFYATGPLNLADKAKVRNGGCE